MESDTTNTTSTSQSINGNEELFPEAETENQNGYNSSDDNMQTCPISNIGESNLQSDYRQFHVLDEIENDSDSKDSEGTDSDVPDEEVERMLEEALVNRKRTSDQAELGSYLKKTRLYVLY